jgi:hypothetical protein
VVSSLDGLIAKNDNSVSWLEGTGTVYEAGISISEEEAATFVKAIDAMCLAPAVMNMRWNWAGHMAILRPSW